MDLTVGACFPDLVEVVLGPREFRTEGAEK
jgi:hypothetical protein